MIAYVASTELIRVHNKVSTSVPLRHLKSFAPFDATNDQNHSEETRKS